MSAEIQPRPESRGIVKKILSGDTVIIRDQPRGKKPEEWMRSLAFLNVPKLAKQPLIKAGEVVQTGDSKDEAYAWEAREFLRKKLIGKEVRFKFEYSNKSRECGIIFLGTENINELMVSEGYASVNPKSKGQDTNEMYKNLLELEKEAIEKQKGKHSGKESSQKREIINDNDDVSSLEKKTFSGIVEDVIDGSTLKISLEVQPNVYQNIILNLSGIRCPGFRKDKPAEEFAAEARFFTECCLLNRDVQVKIDSVGNNKRIYGSVYYEGRDIAEHLLKQGFAYIVQQSLNASVNISALRAAEREAKKKRLRLFKDHVETPIDSKTHIYEVTEIINGDAIKIRDLKTNVEKKIFLSSIRPPPRPESVTGKFKPLYDVPFMFEAREYLRTHLIGKKVQVIHDYTQPGRPAELGKPEFPEKECCTVLIADNKNIAEALVAKGLASVVKHKQTDEKSHFYDALYDAELKAQKSKRGIYGKPAAPMRVVDLSTEASKAKQYITFLTRGNSDKAGIDAIVEYVYSSSRVKVYIPKENCLLNLILAGINAPKSGDEVGDKALNYVRSLVHQRDVQVSIEATDKAGINFIGYLYFEDKNISLELLKRGFAELRDAKNNQFIQAEKDAKDKRLGMWKNYKEIVEVKEEEDHEETPEIQDEKPNKKDKRDEVVITHISPQLTSVYVQYVSNGPKLDELLNELREELNSNPPLAGSYHVKKGEIVAAKFSADGLWYRAKVEKIVDKTISVLFIDYGNRENLVIKDIANLPSSKFGINPDGPTPAKEVGLAFVEFPTDLDQLEDARVAFTEDTKDKILNMKREYTDPVSNLDYVTFLYDDQDIVLNLVTEGLILFEKKRRERRLDKIMSEYKAAQETAKRKRLNLWQYGDFTEDDAKEFGAGKK